MARLTGFGLLLVLGTVVPVLAQQNIPLGVPQRSAPPPGQVANTLGMKFVWIRPGDFMMGSPRSESGRSDHELQHKVILSHGFYMQAHLVTQQQWQAVMGSNPSQFKGDPNLPVDSVSWFDCQEFIKRLRAADKKAYRLPTEAEWEYACRAGTTIPYSSGDTLNTELANFDGSVLFRFGTSTTYRRKTTPVGSFRPNPWGLYDMHGNLWEWCADVYGSYPEKDAIDPRGPEQGNMHVLRGGSWYTHASYCRSASRTKNAAEHRSNDYGLRVCFSVE